MFILHWLNDQLLKMKWLEAIVNWFFKDVVQLDVDSLFYKAITFFFYDVIKIFILLSVLIFITALIQSYFTPERTGQILSKFKGVWAKSVSALLGTVTPFCSCSSIPIFIGFTKAGLPIGTTFSFLISSPLVDIASIILLASVFNWKIAIAYVVLGLVLAVVGGVIIERLQMEDHIEPFAKQSDEIPIEIQLERPTKKERFTYAFSEVHNIIKKVWVYILVGVGIGAFIHGYIPSTYIEGALGSKNPFSVIIATFVGAPMYADIFGTLPIAESLVMSGAGLGTVLAFMMSVTALSLPSITMLKRVMKPKLLTLFISIVIIGIIIIGYVFNAFGSLLL